MPKRRPLVCQHLENVSRKVLEKHQTVIRHLMRGRHGVYALYRGRSLYYVGLATNLNRRLQKHLSDRHEGSWDRFSVYLTIGDEHMKELESLLLRIVKPAGNCRGGEFLKSQDLLPQLEADIRAGQKQELDALVGRQTRAASAAPEPTAPVNGRPPVLARHVSGRMRIKGRFRNRTLRAWVRRDGSIRYDGQVFNSPSTAAARACGRRRCNGWQFWTYERAPGDWVRLTELRR